MDIPRIRGVTGALVVHEVDQDNPRWVPVFVDHVSWSEVVVVIQVEVRDSGDV